MSIYLMPVSRDVQLLLGDVADELVANFGISWAEAIARINAHWRGQDLSSEIDIVLHEDACYWAVVIYFGKDVPDWSPAADRSTWTARPRPSYSSGCWTVGE